jgi:hypothetical protein
VSSQPRITADFNYGGRDGDKGVVYLAPDTVRELERAGIELREGLQVTLSDFDGTEEEPTWLVASGVITVDRRTAGPKCSGWKFLYPWGECWWEPRTTKD